MTGTAAGRPVGLAPVPPAEVAAALRRAGEANPLLGFRAQLPAGIPAVAWVDGPSVASPLVAAVRVWLGTAEPRVAASMVILGYAARLVGPTAAVLLRDGLLPDVRPPNVAFSYAPSEGFQLALTRRAGWRGPVAALCDAWCRVVLEEHLGPAIAAVRAVVPVAAGLLWGNVASGLAGAVAAVARSGAVPAGEAYELGRRLLGCGPLVGSGALTLHNGRIAFRRRSCCLYYRLPGGGMCADCALPAPAQ